MDILQSNLLSLILKLLEDPVKKEKFFQVSDYKLEKSIVFLTLSSGFNHIVRFFKYFFF